MRVLWIGVTVTCFKFNLILTLPKFKKRIRVIEENDLQFILYRRVIYVTQFSQD